MNSLSPGVLIVSFFLSLLVIFLPPNPTDLLFILLCLSIAVHDSNSYKPIRRFIILAIPFAIPLFFAHTIVNTTFNVDWYLLGFIPIRSEGLSLALSVSRKVFIFLSFTVLGFNLSKDQFLDWLISKKFPLMLCSIFALGLATVSLIERRGEDVYKAQQARGIPVGPGVILRIKALPSVLLPVVASLLNETEERTDALFSRGFFSANMTSYPVSTFQGGDHLRLLAVGLPILLRVLV